MLTIPQAVRNIAKIAKRSTPNNWATGVTWYSIAHTFCVTASEAYAIPLDKVVGVLALLSPQCAWETNKLATLDMLERRDTTRQVYPDNITKALRLLNGETFEQITNHRRYGHKVRAFYDNILLLDKSEAVTVDTHATRAAFNLVDLSTRHVRWVFECGGNKVIAEAYKQVARHYKIAPHKLQATVWLHVKDSLERNTSCQNLTTLQP